MKPAYRIPEREGSHRTDGVLVRWWKQPDPKPEWGGFLAFIYEKPAGGFAGDICHEWGSHVEGSTQLEVELAVEAILTDEGWTCEPAWGAA